MSSKLPLNLNGVNVEMSEEAESRVRKQLQNRKCTKCSHFPVCQIFKTFKPMVEKMFKENNVEPVKAENLAMICSKFVSTAGR